MTTRLLSKELQKKAKKELNEEPNRIKNDINHLRDWLAKQPHLNARTDDQWLLTFLRCCKFSLQRAKSRLDFFYTLRTLTPEIFSNRDPMLPEIQDILNRGVVVVLPKLREADGPVITINRWCKANPQENAFLNIIKTQLMTAEVLLMENDNYSVAGEEIIEDLAGYGYLKQNTPAACKKMALCFQSACPVRIKAIHIINAPSFFETIFNLFKPLISEKIRSRIKIHGKGNLNKLYKDIPVSILPKQYGGQGGCADEITAEWKKKIEGYRDWFLQDAQYISDESKRPGEPITSADLFGVEGSFRKLDID